MKLKYPTQVLLVTCVAMFMAFVDITIVNVAFPNIVKSFPDSSLNRLSWIINSYTIVFAALLLPAGRIADLFGRKRIFLGGIAVFTASSAACALAPSLAVLIAARAVQGAAAAAMIPTSLALMLPAFEPAKRPFAIGMWGASNSVAAAVGPALGGALVQLSDWRLVFLINIPIGVIALIPGLRVLAEYRIPGDRRLPDLAGTFAMATGIGLVVLGIVEGNDWGWLSIATLGTFTVGALLTALALRRSTHHPVPAIETSLWQIPGFAAVNLGSLLSGITFFAILLSGSLFLTSIWHYTILDAGLALTSGAVASAIAAPFAGVISARIGEGPVVFIGSLFIAATVLALAAFANSTPNFWGLWFTTSLSLGTGIGLIFPTLASAAVKGVPAERLGAGIALNMTARQVGGALGVALLIAILTSGHPGIERFQVIWIGCAAIALLTGTAAMVLKIGGAAEPQPLTEGEQQVTGLSIPDPI